MQRRFTLLLILTIGSGPFTPAAALTARELLDQMKALDDTTRHWTDRTQTMTLGIHAKGGGERQRSLRVFDRRAPDGEDKSVSFFLTPPDVKGTAFLQWSHKGRNDDQWLYLPELDRTRRITAQGRDQSFMGTDFSYRDLELLAEIPDWTEADAASQLRGGEDIDARPCHVIELRPLAKDAGYGRIVLWLDTELLVSRKLDFFDDSGVHVKTLHQRDFRNIGAIPTAHRLEMGQLEKGSRTEVEISDVRYDAALSDDVFTERQLKRGVP
jgi:outer membrane lipoprotein-sorting protein